MGTIFELIYIKKEIHMKEKSKCEHDDETSPPYEQYP